MSDHVIPRGVHVFREDGIAIQVLGREGQKPLIRVYNAVLGGGAVQVGATIPAKHNKFSGSFDIVYTAANNQPSLIAIPPCGVDIFYQESALNNGETYISDKAAELSDQFLLSVALRPSAEKADSGLYLVSQADYNALQSAIPNRCEALESRAAQRNALIMLSDWGQGQQLCMDPVTKDCALHPLSDVAERGYILPAFRIQP